MMLEFSLKKHFGRVDLYPLNEAARIILAFKKQFYSLELQPKIKCVSKEELEFFKALGHEIRIVEVKDFETLKP